MSPPWTAALTQDINALDNGRLVLRFGFENSFNAA